MSSIIVNEQCYPLPSGATVLDTLLEAGLDVSFGCRAGVCHSCLVRASAGDVPAEAQQGLKQSQKEQGWFLACRCRPTGELSVELDAAAVPQYTARVVEKQLLAPRVMGVWLESESALDYRAGQYVTLRHDSGIGRNYSLASRTGSKNRLELHIARTEGGALSPWIHDTMAVGDQLSIEGPMGECCYLGGESERPLLLVGTGTGLAPLYGVLSDALQQGHHGSIHLFHGARSLDYLYYYDELRALSEEYGNLHYYPSLVESDGAVGPEIEVGPIDRLLSKHLPNLEGWRVYLSGAPDIVNTLRKQCFLAGAGSNAIHADPFG